MGISACCCIRVGPVSAQAALKKELGAHHTALSCVRSTCVHVNASAGSKSHQPYRSKFQLTICGIAQGLTCCQEHPCRPVLRSVHGLELLACIHVVISAQSVCKDMTDAGNASSLSHLSRSQQALTLVFHPGKPSSPLPSWRPTRSVFHRSPSETWPAP